MPKIDTIDNRVEEEMENWSNWYDSIQLPKLDLKKESSRDYLIFDEARALRIEKALLVLKSINLKYFDAVTSYWINYKRKYFKEIAEALNVDPKTLRLRREHGYEFLAGYLF